MTFLEWDDTRRLVRAGEPDRTNDLVALVRDGQRPDRKTWLVAEIEEEAGPGIFYRTGQYELLLGTEVNPMCDPDGATVGSLVLNLSGMQKVPRLEWSWGVHGTRLAPFIVDVARQDAVATLERIEREELGLTVLPFLALMDGGGTAEFVDRWKLAVEKEPDAARRMLYRDAALVFVDLMRWSVTWIARMEGWVERKSSYIEGWKRVGAEEAELLTMRKAVLRNVQVRLENPPPEAIRLAVEGTNDLATLDRWHAAAATAPTVAALRREMKLDP